MPGLGDFAVDSVRSTMRCLLAIGMWLITLTDSGLSQISRSGPPEIPQRQQSRYDDVDLYIDGAPDQLMKRVPQLKSLVPSENQHELREILEKTGERVDDFFRHIKELAAHEDISLTRLKQDFASSTPQTGSMQVSDSYLIISRPAGGHYDIREYRTDAKGENFDKTVVDKGFMLTSGFALMCNYFSPAFQPESRFRQLGEDQVDGRDTYVVGFAQQADATLSVRMLSRTGAPINVLVQGIAWIDKSTYQIVRLRTDLLAPRWDAGLSQQTTVVTLNETRLRDIEVPLWLPGTVEVFVEFTTHSGNDKFFDLKYTNEHKYSDYQRYRAESKVIP
jgi:hypothetical protein